MDIINRNLDGIFVRVERDGKYYSLCLSDITREEREKAIANWGREGLINTIHYLCEAIREIGDQLDIKQEFE